MGSWSTSPRDARGREQHSHWPVRLHALRSTVALQYPPTATTLQNTSRFLAFSLASRFTSDVSQFPSFPAPFLALSFVPRGFTKMVSMRVGADTSVPKPKRCWEQKQNKTKSQGRKEKRSRATGSPRHSVGQQGFTGSGPKGLGVGDDLIIFIVGRSTESLLLY